MSPSEPEKDRHYLAHEPKFCKCRLCHTYFYADTIEEARDACRAHVEHDHPQWGLGGCYCPD